MNSGTRTIFAVCALAAFAQAASQGTSATGGAIPLPLPSDAGLPTTGTVWLTDAISAVNAHSAEFASLVGTATFLSVEAQLGLFSAEAEIWTATQVTAYVTEINSTPIVEVSSVGGPVITLATGTAGSTTTFAGLTFVAVPNSQSTGAVTSKTLMAGVAAVLGSMALGAIAVL